MIESIRNALQLCWTFSAVCFIMILYVLRCFILHFERKMDSMAEILNVPEIFGCDVFNEATMKERLPENIYAAWKHCVTTGTQLSL